MNNQNRRKLFHQKIFYILVLSIVFFIPLFGRILPTLIFLLCLNWLAEGSWIKTISLLFKERNRSGMISFSVLYLLYILGLSYSTNMDYGLFDLEVKFSLFLFPLMFATAEPFYLQKETSTAILFFFIAGCFTVTLLLYAHALYAFAAYHTEDAFYYTKLSWYFHPSYLAMYVTFAIAILAYWLLEAYPVFNRYQLPGILLLIVHFFIFIVFLNSKAGLIALFMVIFIYALLFVIVKRTWIYGAVTIVAAGLLFLGCLTLFPNVVERVRQSGSDIHAMDSAGKDPRSTAERIAIWKCSMEIISKHVIFGVGTGDVKDALMESYKEHQDVKILSQKLNAHNQYLQTFISLGIFGLILLLYMLFFPAIRAFRQKDFLFMIFLAIFAVNIMVESMLENQAGVIFYALFNALLFTFNPPDPSVTALDILARQTRNFVRKISN